MLVALWFAATGLVGHAQAQGTPRPRRSIEITETNSAEILTNLNLLNSKKEGISDLEDQLRTLRKMSPEPSFDGNWTVPYLPPSGSKASNKTLRELLDRQKNWGLTSEEMSTVLGRGSESDTLSTYGDEKGNKDKKTSLQQFYDTLNNRNPDRKKQDATTDLNSFQPNKRFDAMKEFNSDDDSGLPEGIRDKAQKLKDLVSEDNSSIFNPTRARSTFDNFFGLTDYNPSSSEPVTQSRTTTSESFIDQFKKTLGRQSTPSSLAPGLNALVPSAPDNRASMVPGLEPFTGSKKQEFTQTIPGNSTTLVDPTALRDVNASILNSWNPLYQAPKLELTKPPAPPPSASFMQVPRRHF